MEGIKGEKRAGLVRDFSVVGVVVLLIFAVENYIRGNYGLSFVEGTVGVVVALNLLTLWRWRWIETAAVVSAVGVLTVLLIMYLTGGMGGTGAYWYFVFPVVTFYLVKREAGYALFGLLFFLTIGLWGGGEMGYWQVAYDGIETRQLLVSYLVMGILIAYYQRASDLYEQEISQARGDLNKTSQELKVQKQDLESKRQELENNQVAMLNLLEDAKELEEQLKIEKAGVEMKVEERTGEIMAVIDSIARGLLVVDKERMLILANKAIAHMINKQKPDYDSLKQYFGENIDLEKMVEEVLAKKIDVKLEPKLIESRYLEVHVVPVMTKSEASIKEVAIFVHDVTEATNLQRTRDEFFSIASHELRTPLTAIRGNAEMILDNYKDKITDKDIVEMLSDIHEGSVRLIEIVNDFLNVSRLEMGKMEFKIEKLDVREMLSSVIKEFQATGSEKELTIELLDSQEFISSVQGDSDRIKQVVINLIGNSFKFTKKGGVKIELREREGEVIVLVHDSGEGIAPEQRGLLFQKFQQAGSSLYTRDTSKGTGLGLYISKLMIEGMGGKIWLEKSEVGKGSTFAFSLKKA